MLNYIDFETRMTANYNGLQPINVKGVSNINNYYQVRYLYNKIYSKFKFDFGDLKWDLNTFRMLLFRFGSVAIFKSKDAGWIFAPWSVEKLNLYLNPKKIRGYKLYYNEYFADLEGEVDKDCVIVKIMDDYLGLQDLVESTAELLANCDKTINIALMNANVNLVAYADDKKEAEEIKQAYAQATKGEPLVVTNKNKLKEGKDNLLEPFTNHDTVMSMDRLLTCRRTIVNNFLTEIGINNANNNKKERLITDEVNANDEEVSANISVIYDNIKKGFEAFNKISGLNISVELNETDNADFNPIEESGGENNV